MINPNNITNYNRTEKELQEFLLFSIVVAGKNSKVQAQKLEQFIDIMRLKCVPDDCPDTPFAMLGFLAECTIELLLRAVKMGQYNRITKAFAECAKITDLKTASLEELGQVRGIGPKTARFFLLHSRKDVQCAVLDTHILKHLRANGIEAPATTPQSAKQYRRLELAFINLWKIRNHFATVPLTLAQYDLSIWKMYSK